MLNVLSLKQDLRFIIHQSLCLVQPDPLISLAYRIASNTI